MKRTAVEWLEIVLIPDPISEEDFGHNINCWKQAKQMERANIIDAYLTNPLESKWKNIGTDYYNETYNANEK
jgi:hypothetical protein